MAREIKTPIQKLKTKIDNLLRSDSQISRIRKQIKVRRILLFSYNQNYIMYSTNRYFPSKVDSIVQENFEVHIPITNDNLYLLSSNMVNPPRGTRIIYDIFSRSTSWQITKIILGSELNEFVNGNLYVTNSFYNTIVQINKEESRDKVIRFRNRVSPFLNSQFHIDLELNNSEIDYKIILQEAIARGELDMNDIMELTDSLEVGDISQAVVQNQINRQAEWLIDVLEEILEEEVMNKQKAKTLGRDFFGYTLGSINGPEHLMEKILTDYGQYTLFGVPVLLNINQYVINTAGLSRSQFDLVLVNHLADVEVVELKRPDATVLEYDEGRNKFYASKDLAIAVSQSERYISAVYRDNDLEYAINGLTLRDFLNQQIAGAMAIEVCRPKALIVMGSARTITPSYESLKASTKSRISLTQYNLNSSHAYKEIKEAFKNIHVLTYSELIDTARTRLVIQEERQE